MIGDVLRSGPATGTFVLTLHFDDAADLDLELPIRGARISMSISEDRKTISNGMLAGVIATADLETALARFFSPAEIDSCTSLALKDRVRQASDILSDGTQDPSRDCDGISIGLGFDVAAVQLGAIAPAAMGGGDPCSPKDGGTD